MRCFYCGSQNVALIRKNDGYSLKKGIVGAAILGPVGAVAGINGKTSNIYHCAACGQDSAIIMDVEIEKQINNAFLSNDVDTLKLYKKMYHNIEWQDNQISTERFKQHNNEYSHSEKGGEVQRFTVGELKIRIREYLNEMNAPVSLDDLKSKFNKPQEVLFLDEALNNLKKKGMIKEPLPKVYALVRDINEMQELIAKQEGEGEKTYGRRVFESAEKKAVVAEGLAHNIVISNNFIEYLNTDSVMQLFNYTNNNKNVSPNQQETTNQAIEELKNCGRNVVQFYILDTTGGDIFGFVLLKEDGKVDVIDLTYAQEERKKLSLFDDIIDIEIYYGHIYGLCVDGTVHAVKNKFYDKNNVLFDHYKKEVLLDKEVEKWNDIKQLHVMDDDPAVIVGIRNNGTVCYSFDGEGYKTKTAFSNVKDAVGNGNGMLGLYEDGTVEADMVVCKNTGIPYEKWNNIFKLYAYDSCLFGLSKNGNVFYDDKKYSSMKEWRGICQLVFGIVSIAGLTVEGKVMFWFDHNFCANYNDTDEFRKEMIEATLRAQAELSKWENIACIYFSDFDPFAYWGITNDGRIVSTDQISGLADVKLFDSAEKYVQIRDEIKQNHFLHMKKTLEKRLAHKHQVELTKAKLLEQLEQRKAELQTSQNDWVLKRNSAKRKVELLSKSICENKELMNSYQGIFQKKKRIKLEKETTELSNQLESAKNDLNAIILSNPFDNDQELKSIYLQYMKLSEN